MGDEDELVTLACASALLSLAPKWGLRALRRMFFEGDPSTQDLSSLAIGAARHEGALEMLFEFLDGTVVPQERALVLRGLGLQRGDSVNLVTRNSVCATAYLTIQRT
jgi:hypothetical protein